MNLTAEQLQDIAKVFKARLDRDGYVGLDFNMAVLCILEMLGIDTGIKLQDPTKLEYWANKRDFCEAHFDSEAAILDAAHAEVVQIVEERQDFRREELAALGLIPGRPLVSRRTPRPTLSRPSQDPLRPWPGRPTQELFDMAWAKFTPRYEDQVYQIVAQAAKLGIVMDVRQAHTIWKYYSASMAATWIDYDDERVEKALKIYIADKLQVDLDQETLDNPL